MFYSKSLLLSQDCHYEETVEGNKLHSCIRHAFQVGTKIISGKIHPRATKTSFPPGGQISLLKCSSNPITAQLKGPPWLPAAC